MQKEGDPLNSISYLPLSSSIRGVSCHPFIPRSFHSLMPSNVDGSLEPAGWFCGNSDLPQYVRRTKFIALRRMQHSLELKKTRSSSKHHLSVPNDPPTKKTRATLPEMASRVDDLNIQQDQTPDFALISSVSKKFNRQFVALYYFPISLASQGLQERGGRGKMVLSVVKAVPASCKPSARVDVSIFPGERHNLALQRVCQPEHHLCI